MVRGLVLCLLLTACDAGTPRAPEAGSPDRARPGEGLPPPSETQPRRMIDFVVQGCSERTTEHCIGPVPLALTFSAVVEGDPRSLGWDFGDGSPTQSGPVASHTYVGQGSFTVTLAAVTSSGSVSEQKVDFVQVDGAGPGSACSSDKACATGTCVCRESCPFPLSLGLCLQPCETLACHLAGTTCIDLSVPELVNPPVWRTRLCLPTCTTTQDCRAGFVCRLAPSSAGWVNACVPPFPRTVGSACRAGTGAPDPTQCIGGLCLDLGASGYCSAACAVGDCPTGTRCARLGPTALAVCMLRCVPGSCEDDPRLRCELPAASGQYGFEIVGPADPQGTRYCAPRRCQLDEGCGGGGRCDLAKGGFCVPAT